MTKILRISLLGDVSIRLGENSVSGLPSRTAEALLIYLVCSPRPVAREKLAELLWADRTQVQAMTNLRTILTALRRELGDFLSVTRQTLAFDHHSAYWLDVAEFEKQLTEFDLPRHASIEGFEQQLAQILDLYRGDFLDGFYIREGRGFEEWTTLQRERLRRLAWEGFRSLAQYQLEAGSYVQGIATASRWQRLDPYHEEACRTLMWLLARAGQRNAALRQYQELKQKLAADLNVFPASATTTLFRRIQALNFPPPNNLPSNANPFIGRVEEIAALERQISASPTRLLTLLGPGGVGKTRLAIETARFMAKQKPGHFIDGIFFAPLAAVDSPEALPIQIAEAASLALSGSESPQQEVLNHLREREILLILDNFEQLIDDPGSGIAFLVSILNHAPGVKLLITSRQRLNLYEETIFDLQGLDLPLPGTGFPEKSGAVALFLQNARRIDSRFTPSSDELTCIAQACRLVEGLPLAIELAAGWMRHYACAEIVGHIESSLDFLNTNYRDMPERHRSLRAVFEHSWNLLSPGEQEALAQLSIFRGGFTLEAAVAVLTNLNAERAVLSLTEKSLAQQSSDGRFDIHPLLRQYASEKLLLRPEGGIQAEQRHAVFYIDFLLAQASGEAPEQRIAIRQEINNLQAAWKWAARHRELTLLEKAAPVLHNFYSAQSWFQEGIKAFQFALDSLVGETIAHPTQAALLCDLFGRKARMEIQIGQLAIARADLQEALAYLERVEDPDRRATVIGYLAITHFYAGSYQDASDLADESRRLSEKSGDQDGLAFALNFLGSCAKALGDYAAARESFLRSLEIYRSLEDGIGAAMTLNNLGNLAQAAGDYEAAQQHYQECSALFKAHDHIHGAATTLTNAGKLAMRQGKYAEAQRMLTEGLEMKRSINDPRGMAVALISLGDVALAQGENCQARDWLSQGLSLALASGDVHLLLDSLAVAADWMLKQGDDEAAIPLLSYVRDQQATSQETRTRATSIIADLPDQSATLGNGIPSWLDAEIPPEEVATKIFAAYFESSEA